MKIVFCASQPPCGKLGVIIEQQDGLAQSLALPVTGESLGKTHSGPDSVEWKYIMALTLTGVRHLISPRWLEKM